MTEDLQGEVRRVLNKCAKFRVGQTVYAVVAENDDRCRCVKVIVTGYTLRHNVYNSHYSIWYRLRRRSDGREWSATEDELYASSDELAEEKITQYGRRIERWRNLIIEE